MKINLAERLATIDTMWAPQTVARYNDNEVMVVRVHGEFPFHQHEDSDDFFLILSGTVLIDIEGEQTQTCSAGELCIIPKGRTHRPRAPEPAEILLIEPLGLRETNDIDRVAARDTV